MTNNEIFKSVRLIVHKLTGANDKDILQFIKDGGFKATMGMYNDWKRSSTHERYLLMPSSALKALMLGAEAFAKEEYAKWKEEQDAVETGE